MRVFKGTARLIRLALRRDRVVLPLTIFLVVIMVAGSIPALYEAYPDTAAQTSYVASAATSSVGRIFSGTVQGANLGSIVMAELYFFTAIIVAIMSIFIISRHTRYNEEIGAGEMIGSSVTGRSAQLSAALALAVCANILVGLLLFATLAPAEGLSVDGAALFGASIALVGIFFASIGAITAQLSDYRRGANSLAISILAVSFLVRAFGDALGELSADGLSVTASWISWLSPLGWGYQVLPFSEQNYVALLLLFIGASALILLSYTLMKRRDIGSSIFQAKAGPNRAPSYLLSITGLGFRLQRSQLYAWLTAFILAGSMITVVANDYREAFEETELFQELLAPASGSFTDTVIASMFPLIAAMLSAYVVATMIKVSQEETSGRLEQLLASAKTRTAWLVSNSSLIAGGAVLCFVVMGFFGGISYYIAADTPETEFMDIVISSGFNIPAMLLFLSILTLVFSVSTKFFKSFAWFAYAFVALIGSFASIFSWPQWTQNLSPFSHTPLYPATDIDYGPLYVMLILAAILTVLSIVIFSRRDLQLK